MFVGSRSRRKPARSVAPYGNRVEDGLSVRAALPADLLDVLFMVSVKQASDGKALNRRLPMHDRLENDVAERQAHRVWKQLEAVVRLDAGVETPDGDEQSVPRPLFDIVMRGLLVGTLVGAGSPHAIRRHLRRFKLTVPVAQPGIGEEEAQKVRDRFAEESRTNGMVRDIVFPAEVAATQFSARSHAASLSEHHP